MQKSDYTHLNKCIDCDKPISNKAVRCYSCTAKRRWKDRAYKKVMKKRMSGKNNPNYGKKATKKTKELMSNKSKGTNNANYKHGKTLLRCHCKDCGKELSKHAVYYKYKRCVSCSQKYYFSLPGNHPGTWKGGTSYIPYGKNWKAIRKFVRYIYNNTCQRCKKHEINASKLDVHHINYDKTYSHLDNLVLLCKSCHMKTMGNFDYWYAFYTELKEIEKCR